MKGHSKPNGAAGNRTNHCHIVNNNVRSRVRVSVCDSLFVSVQASDSATASTSASLNVPVSVHVHGPGHGHGHGHGHGYGILLFVLTALTLTSLITPTEQSPNGTRQLELTMDMPMDNNNNNNNNKNNMHMNGNLLPSVVVGFNRTLMRQATQPPQSPVLELTPPYHKSGNGNGNGNGNATGGNHYPDYDDEAFANCKRSSNFALKLISMILYALVCIIGLFGNTLVIYVVLRFSKMQTVTNIYILNLAIADECFLIGIPFLLYTMQVENWSFGDYMCKAYMVSTSITSFTSSIFLLIMSADRYLAVCHPISSPRYRTPFVSKLVSAFAWMTSVLLMLPVILFASTVSRDGHISCNIEWPDTPSTSSDSTFILYSLILGFATPLTFILVFYCLVIRKLHTVGPKHKSKEKKRSHRKVTKLVLTVITVYIMCWLPHWISQVALINSTPKQCGASRLELAVFLACGCLSYSNSAMNPILYAFLSDNFKKSFMKACTCAARKDVNAQLQLENSFFPKFGKGRQSERLIGGGGGVGSGGSTTTGKGGNIMAKKKTLVASRKNNAPMATTTTTTTTTTAGTDAITCVQPAAVHVSSLDDATITPATPAMIKSDSPGPGPGPGPGTSAALLVVNAETNNCKPPVLHTDL